MCNYYPHRLCRSAWVGFSSQSVCLYVCGPQHNSENEWSQSVQTWCREWPWDILEVLLFWGSKVKVIRRINAHAVNAQYLPNGKAYEATKFKLGIQTEHEDPYQRQAPWPSGPKVKVARSRVASDRCRPISRERNVLETPKLVGRLPTPRATMPRLHVSRSKVKGQGHMFNNTYNNTLFRTTIAFYSHLLGVDTSTITLPPRFIVIRYSLGGDTDKSNTAWVRTLWVHSSSVLFFSSFRQCGLLLKLESTHSVQTSGNIVRYPQVVHVKVKVNVNIDLYSASLWEPHL